MQSSPVSHYFLPLTPKHPLGTLFSNTVSPRSSLSVSDQVSHPQIEKEKHNLTQVQQLKQPTDLLFSQW
jgi:hypothetical protein